MKRSLDFSSQECLRTVIIKVFLSGPVLVFVRGEDGSVSESENMAGQILLDLYPSGYDNLIRIDEFVGRFDEVFSDPALSDEVHYGEEQEGLVRCEMVGNVRVSVPALVSPKLSEHLEVFLKHLSVQALRALVCFLSTLGRGQVSKGIE